MAVSWVESAVSYEHGITRRRRQIGLAHRMRAQLARSILVAHTSAVGSHTDREMQMSLEAIERFSPGNHHFVLAPVAPTDRFAWVGIRRVVETVVVVKRHDHPAPFFHQDRLLESVL